MRPVREIREAADLIAWLASQADPSPARTDLEHMQVALEWVLEQKRQCGNPLRGVLRQLRRMKARADRGKSVPQHR